MGGRTGSSSLYNRQNDLDDPQIGLLGYWVAGTRAKILCIDLHVLSAIVLLSPQVSSGNQIQQVELKKRTSPRPIKNDTMNH